MLDKSAKIFMTMFKNYNNGADTYVFDLLYEHSLPYSALKAVLDGLVCDGVAATDDLKTYRLIGDVQGYADRVLTSRQPFGALGDAQARLVEKLDAVRKAKEEEGDGADYFERLFNRFNKFCNVVETDGEDEEDEDEDSEDDEDDNILFCDEIDYVAEDDGDGEDDLIADGEDEENDDDDEDDDGDILNGDVFGFNGTATGCECVEKARDYFSRRRELYSDDFCNVIETTFEIAQDSNHGYISPEHLVYAMLNCDCGARGILVAAGADAQTYGEQFFYVYDKRLWTVGFTPRTRLLMDRAFLLAQDIGGVDAKPRSEHLLLVTLMQQSCLAVKILKLLGVDMDKLSDGLDKALKNPDE